MTIDYWNEMRRLHYLGEGRTGLVCPDCKQVELLETQPGTTYAESPPKKPVYCPDCGWKGAVLV